MNRGYSSVERRAASRSGVEASWHTTTKVYQHVLVAICNTINTQLQAQSVRNAKAGVSALLDFCKSKALRFSTVC
jgi:hypothetical protein